MVEQSLLEELTPPGERHLKADVDASILEAIAERKISYPSEIVGDTGINRQTVYDHIRHLAKEGKLEKIFMRLYVPEELKERLQEFWDMGLKGNALKRMSWYRVTDGTKKEK